MVKMLRRNPTRITLTTEDITLYEENRNREAMEREALLRHEEALAAQQQRQNSSSPQQFRRGANQNFRDPNDELKPLPGDKARVLGTKSREERLGLGIGGAGTGGSGSRG